ncbi:MAG TPA: SDR family NAD(P)-dependent oxidoreductase, partial [Chloroflexota bacterium]
MRRTHHAERLALVGATTDDLIEQLDAARAGEARKGMSRGSADTHTGKIAFVFSGMGTQWLGMGRELLEGEAVFRDAIERCDAAVGRYAGWSVRDEILANSPDSRLDDIGVLQPVLFSIAVALTDLWRSWGVESDGIVGHSVGEIAAACAAGALSLDEAARVVCARAASLRPAGGKGAMLSVGLPVQDAMDVLEGYGGRVSVGVVNSPTTTVLSGEPAALREIEVRLDTQGVFCRFVKSDIAFHSPQMEPLLESFQLVMSEVHAGEPAIPVYSTVTTARCDGQAHNAAYWLRNFREPVAFSQTIERMLEDGYDTFVEISPHPVLTHVIQETANYAGKKVLAFPSLRREEGERRAMLQSLGGLFVEGYPVRFAALYPAGGRCVSLPTYPWQRERFWIDDRGRNRPRRTGRHGWALLGEPVVSAAHAGKLVWEIGIDLSTFPYLADHVVASSILFPAAAFAEMALAVADEIAPGPHVMEHLTIMQGLVLAADSMTTLQVVASAGEPGTTSLQFLSRETGEVVEPDGWVLHAQCTVRLQVPSPDEAPGTPSRPEEIEAPLGTSAAAVEHYREMTMRALNFGAAFQAVERIHRSNTEAVAYIRVPEAAGGTTGYHLHPVVLDACFQTFSSLTPLEPYLPTGIERLRVHDVPTHGLWIHARRLTENKYEDVLDGDIRLFNADGQLVAEILGFRVQRRRTETDDVDDWLYETRWEPGTVLDRAGQSALPEDWQGSWIILTRRGDELGRQLASLLEACGLPCTLVFAGESYERIGPQQYCVNPCLRDDFALMLAATSVEGLPVRGVVDLWAQDRLIDREVSSDILQEVQSSGTIGAMHLVQALSKVNWAAAPRLWLVTRGAQAIGEIGETGLAQSPLLGFGRVLANELPELRCTRIDLDPVNRPDDAQLLLSAMFAGDREDEVALRGGARYVPRLVRYRPTAGAAGDAQAAAAVSTDVPIQLHTAKPGILDGLGFRLAERRSPGPGQLEIRVEATGLNFRDLMSAMGILSGYPDGLGPLGYECAGVVVAVGEDVADFRVGDEVVALSYRVFKSYVTADARLTVLKPARLTFDEAVTIPITFLTAHYALHHLARLEAGERVLIHSAAGGVGLAAIQLAQAAGAEIFATAGSPEKRDFLRSLGITHVMDSRSLDFAEEIMRLTDGRGVDMVLNSLAGEFIPKSLSVLGPYGRFLEIGRRDIYENSQLGLYPFQRNLSFFAIDLDRLVRERPEFVNRQLRQVMALVESSSLHPLPRTVYPAGEVVDAFRQMAQAKHIGKIVVSFADVRVPLQASGEVRFRSDASYLITGGLGGLGLKVARWMVERGARSLVLVSRRGATPKVESDLASLRDAGCGVTCARVDVARQNEVAGLLNEIERSLAPLRGVIHAAGVLDDTTVLGLTRERVERVMAPKIAGAWNLHRLTLHMPLDFFILFSSLATAFGNGGQGNYAAANQLLDTLSHFRRKRGLPALSIAWGPWSEVGMVSSVDLLDRLTAGGVMGISPRRGLAAL